MTAYPHSPKPGEPSGWLVSKLRRQAVLRTVWRRRKEAILALRRRLKQFP